MTAISTGGGLLLPQALALGGRLPSSTSPPSTASHGAVSGIAPQCCSSSFTMMFSGLMSQCMYPFPWTKAREARHWWAIARTTEIGRPSMLFDTKYSYRLHE